VRTDEWKYITDGDSEQLYDLTNDPGEQSDVSADHPEVGTDLLEEVPESLKERKPKRPRAPRDEVDRERLEALGYIEERE
jgi:arylsulfatase A-like enzyme